MEIIPHIYFNWGTKQGNPKNTKNNFPNKLYTRIHLFTGSISGQTIKNPRKNIKFINFIIEPIESINEILLMKTWIEQVQKIMLELHKGDQPPDIDIYWKKNYNKYIFHPDYLNLNTLELYN